MSYRVWQMVDSIKEDIIRDYGLSEIMPLKYKVFSNDLFLFDIEIDGILRICTIRLNNSDLNKSYIKGKREELLSDLKDRYTLQLYIDNGYILSDSNIIDTFKIYATLNNIIKIEIIKKCNPDVIFIESNLENESLEKSMNAGIRDYGRAYMFSELIKNEGYKVDMYSGEIASFWVYK